MKSRISIADHADFRKSLNSEPLAGLLSDDDFDDLLDLDPYVPGAPSRRSDRELNQLLSILDSLEGGKS
jgi:hypothetical protein